MLVSEVLALAVLSLVPYAASQDVEDHGLQARDIDELRYAMLLRRAALGGSKAKSSAPAKAKSPAGGVKGKSPAGGAKGKGLKSSG